MDKLLVFGSGFLVKHISDVFIHNGAQVKIIFNKHRTPDSVAEHIQKDEVHIFDLILEFKPDYILLASGDSYVGDYVDIPNSLHKNLMDALFILEGIYGVIEKMSFIKKIVVIGSAAEYGKQYSEPISESVATHPTSIYGLTKIFLYNACLYYFEKGLPIIYTRQFNSVGPYQREVFVLSSFCKQIALIEKGRQIPRIEVGNIEAERDFIDVRDCANAYYLLFQNGVTGDVYNVGSGKSIRVKVLLDQVLANTTYKEQEIEVVSSKIGQLAKNSLADKLLCDNSKLKALGFVPELPLERTILDTLNFWRNNVQ